MEAELEQYRSECFRTPVVGESVMVHDAADGTAYRLTVLGARSETLELRMMMDGSGPIAFA